jgi:predicted enzyme related to lactoylglutathione lyase
MKKMCPVVHFELPAENSTRMVDFYTNVFGWQTQSFGPEMGNYVTAATTESDEHGRPKTPGAINGGFFSKKEAQYPSVVIAVDDIHSSMKEITAAGGAVHGEPVMIPGVGLYVPFTDTEGNKLSILQPSM